MLLSFRRLTARLAAVLLLTLASMGGLAVPRPQAAHAAAACHLAGDSIYGIVGTHYPVTLHGVSVGLRSGVSHGAAYAIGNVHAGDIISIDRANFTISGSASHYWFDTIWVLAHGTYDYCEYRAPANGVYQTFIIDGAHRPVRACLRHNGALQCANWWYADNDD